MAEQNGAGGAPTEDVDFAKCAQPPVLPCH